LGVPEESSLPGTTETGNAWARLESLDSIHRISLSPDEKRLAVQRSEADVTSLWILELGSGILSRLTFNPAGDLNPQWSPGSRERLFSFYRDGQQHLYRKSLGGGEDELIFHSDEDKGQRTEERLSQLTIR